ncbi:hypothetical protein F4802DRAFT_606784 [Xylaria palmicola]|nr:hypothetical protein F4802DRAFT_606784 [Xylaria palmicola]
MDGSFYNISREGSEMTESPVIPPSPAQDYLPIRKPSHSATGSGAPELDKWKSRVPRTGNSPLVPKPLFSSAKCVVEAEPVVATGEALTSSSTDRARVSSLPIISAMPATADTTPVSPSPSLFPIPPSADGIMSSPVNVISLVSLHASNSVASRSSVYSQSTTGNTLAASRPRPVSSIYSQNTLTTVTATAPPSPRTPTLTNWTSALPGLPTSRAPLAETQMSVNTYQQTHVPMHMEQVVEEPSPQSIQTQIQVPRLRSPSLPQDRGNRRRTASYTDGVHTQRGDGSISSRPLVQSPETLSYPQIWTVAADYEGSDWPLQKPSVVHNVPQRHHVSRSQGANAVRSSSYSYHVANKESISSSSARMSGHAGNHDSYIASPRASLADSHTPIRGPEEQRSGWWSDDDDAAEQGRGGTPGYAAIAMKEKPATKSQRRRARNIKLIVGASILAVLIIVGVVVGVTVSLRK